MLSADFAYKYLVLYAIVNQALTTKTIRVQESIGRVLQEE
jgi:hypothetical protein